MTKSRTLAPWGAVAVAFACAACGTTHSQSITDPFVLPSETGTDQPGPATSRPREAVHIDLGERPAPPRPARVPADRAGQIADAPQPGGSPIQLVSHRSPAGPFAVPSAPRSSVRADFTAAEPREHSIQTVSGQYCPPPVVPGFGPPGGPMPPQYGGPAVCGPVFNGLDHPLATSSSLYPDEYLCDGGDRDHPVHYDAFNRLGLDTEDTVAEYVDEHGEKFVEPTNRVCVYAPRFGAVRSVDMPGLEEFVREPGLNRQRQIGVGVDTRLLVVAHTKNDAGVAMRTRFKVSGIDGDVGRGQVDQVDRVAVHDKLINLYENIRYLQTGILEAEQRPLIARRMQAAVAWEGDVAPVAHVKLDGVHQTVSLADAQVIVGLEEHADPAKLRIVKLADKDDAQQGEIVTFTIRYDNLGDAPVHYLKIVDNLTPRLEYVEDSADSDRVGRLVVQDNGVGSLVLIFEVGEPVEGHEGGVVSFQTRVR